MADRMVEKVARAIYTEFIPAIERVEGSTKKQWDNLDPDEDAIYLACWMQMARAALEACHHEELVKALTYLSNEAAAWREGDLAEVGGWTNAHCLTHHIAQARAALAKVKDEGHG